MNVCVGERVCFYVYVCVCVCVCVRARALVIQQLSPQKMNRLKILDEAVRISYTLNTLWQGTHSTIFSPAMGK